jgi:hypothetical protein
MGQLEKRLKRVNQQSTLFLLVVMGVISWRGLEEGQVSGMIARIAITKKFLLPP